MPDDLYERDFLVWSETQAALLRRMAAGERVNAELDWPHLIEEVEDLGARELRVCESLLRQAMVHLLKLKAGADWPESHWRSEVSVFLADARAAFTPAMRQRIDVNTLYRRAVRIVRDGNVAVEVPAESPWPLDDLLDENAAIDVLLAKL